MIYNDNNAQPCNYNDPLKLQHIHTKRAVELKKRLATPVNLRMHNIHASMEAPKRRLQKQNNLNIVRELRTTMKQTFVL